MANARDIEMKLPSLDELFSSQEERDDAKLKRIYDIPLDEIDPFPNHPFKVRDDEDMLNLVESVRVNGVLTPATVRKKEDGRYELLSGHRRFRACELAGIDTLRCEVVDMNRDEGTIFMVESNELHRLDKYDIGISAVAGLTAALVDILMVGIPQKTPEGLKGGVLANYVRDYFDKRFPEEEMQRLANSKVSKVPYDAQDNRNTTQYVEGLSTYYHRLLSLGHDPLIGLVIGVADIMSGSMTTIDKTGKIITQIMPGYADRTEKDLFLAIAKQIIHFKSDITTSMGLPAPLMGLFNLLQFGSIGEEEQTIAEIVQGMYYEGYDFIHFCSLSIPVMIAEVIVRVGYAVKRIKEGHSIKDSIPLSINHEKHPKLGTMLFVGHSAAVAVNAGKVYFTKNPMAINYPQWMAFGKYSYQQLKWGLIEKPEARKVYVDGILNDQLTDVLYLVDRTFYSYFDHYVVVMS